MYGPATAVGGRDAPPPRRTIFSAHIIHSAALEKAMHEFDRNTSTNRAYAVFVSALKTDSAPTATQIDEAAHRSFRCFGGAGGCVAAVAWAYGDHPAEAARRMSWALAVTRRVPYPVRAAIRRRAHSRWAWACVR
jgi:hypothetical protein